MNHVAKFLAKVAQTKAHPKIARVVYEGIRDLLQLAGNGADAAPAACRG